MPKSPANRPVKKSLSIITDMTILKNENKEADLLSPLAPLSPNTPSSIHSQGFLKNCTKPLLKKTHSAGLPNTNQKEIAEPENSLGQAPPCLTNS